MKKIILFTLIAFAILLTGCNETKNCPLDAMNCPDGSTVSRSGPNCEFAACPEPTATSENQEYCDGYKDGPMTEEEIANCTCPEGKVKRYCMASAICSTDSRAPCTAHTDCPSGESCISENGKDWYCTGARCGCFFPDPEEPEMEMCVD